MVGFPDFCSALPRKPSPLAIPGAVIVLDAFHPAGQAITEVPLASQEGFVEALTPTFAWEKQKWSPTKRGHQCVYITITYAKIKQITIMLYIYIYICNNNSNSNNNNNNNNNNIIIYHTQFQCMGIHTHTSLSLSLSLYLWISELKPKKQSIGCWETPWSVHNRQNKGAVESTTEERGRGMLD